MSKRQELNTRLNRLDIDWAERRRELSYVNSRGVRSEPRRAALVALSILSVLAALGTGVALFVGFVEVVPFAAIFFLGALVQAIRYKRTLARYEDAKSRYQRERAALVEQLAPSPLA